jgi:hypothetical protein
MVPGDNAFRDYVPYLDLLRYYVKVEFLLANGNTRWWYGVVNNEQHSPQGYNPERNLRHGEQGFTAYGFEWALSHVKILTSEVRERFASTGFTVVDRGIDFNEGGKPNRTVVNTPHRFTSEREEAQLQYWSTRDIFTYLVVAHPPRDAFGNAIPQYFIQATELAKLSDFDRPNLRVHGRSVLSVMNQLVNRQRLISWWVEPNDTNLQIRFATFTDVPIQIDHAKSIPANTVGQIRILADQSIGQQMSVVRDSIDGVDQVVVQGARARTCFSVGNRQLTIVGDWTDQEVLKYSLGASVDANGQPNGSYPPDFEPADQREANHAARSAEAYDNVFRRFKLPDFFNSLAGNGFAIGIPGVTLFPISPASPNFPNQIHDRNHLYWWSLRFNTSLPLLKGFEYDGNKISLGPGQYVTADPKELSPFAVVPIPGTDGEDWAYAHKIGQSYEPAAYAENNYKELSMSVSVPRDNKRSLELTVHGAPKHVIGKNSFSPLPPDYDREIGLIDWKDLVFTIACDQDRYCEAKFPQDFTANVEMGRVMLIPVGDGYRQDFVTTGTVVGIDPLTKDLLQVSNGGLIRDDSGALYTIAKQAYAWYGKTRVSMSFMSSYQSPCDQIGTGIYVTSYRDGPSGNDQFKPIGSVVSEVTMVFPRIESEAGGFSPGPVQFEFKTAFGELDPLTFGTK